ncbi:unnamed protein product [Cladocopium goreaui]|uniref:Glycosyltransferase n=1 Tax=Cladocopium goreaui TaxID=2562237 RepID=A0A9P1CDB0_9DINO|nr:unnamed protein product [Cladocopium goreaui]
MPWRFLPLGFLPTIKAGAWQDAMRTTEDFEAMTGSSNAQVISFVTAIDPFALTRTNLLEKFPLKAAMVTLLGLEAQTKAWSNLRKVELLHQHVALLPPQKVVFAIDFFDVMWFGCKTDLVETFKSFNRSMVFSAELFPYPMTEAALDRLERSDGYPVLGKRTEPLRTLREKTYKYLNSGCVAGYASALKLATGRILQHDGLNQYVTYSRLAANDDERKQMQMGSDDQIAWHTYALHHPDEIALDYDADLFLSAFGTELPDYSFRAGQVWLKPFNRYLCFAHGNGASNLAVHVAELQQMAESFPRLQPDNCSLMRQRHKEVRGMQVWELFCDWHMLRALAMKPFPPFPRRWRNLEKKSWTRERMGKGIRSGCKARRILGVSLKATSQYQSAPKQHTAYSSFQQFFVCSFQVQVLRFLSYLAVASEMIQRPVVCVAAFHIFSSSQFKRFLPLTRKCTAVKMMVFNIVQQNMCHLPGLLVLTRSKVGQRMLKV